MNKKLILLLSFSALLFLGARGGQSPVTGSGMDLNQVLVDADRDGLYEVADIRDWDGDGSTYETCTAKNSDSAGTCKVDGEVVYNDFVDDVNALLLSYAESDVVVKLRCGVVYRGRACWDAQNPTENDSEADHDDDTDVAHADCVDDEYGTPLYNIAVRGRRVHFVGCGFDDRDNQAGNMGGTSDRPTGRTVGTTLVNDMGSAFATWFDDGGNFNPMISTGVQQGGSYTQDYVGRTGTGPVHSSTNGKGKWAIGLQEPLWHQIERGSVCVCNDAGSGNCSPLTGVKATGTDTVQDLVAGDRVVIQIPHSSDPTTNYGITQSLTVAGVASADGGRCYFNGNISSEATYDGGARTKINVDSVHQLVTGMRVWISGTTDGDYDSSGVEDFTIEVDSATSFIIPVAFGVNHGAGGTWTSGSPNLREVFLGQRTEYQKGTITGWANSGGEARATVAAGQTLKTGDSVTVSGTGGPTYDGTWPVEYVDVSHFILTGSTFTIDPDPDGSYTADEPLGVGGLSYGFVDDADGTGLAYLMHPGQEYWDGYLEISNVTIEPQDPRDESGGDCSDTGDFLIATATDTDEDCDTTLDMTLYGGTVSIHDTTIKGWHAYALDGSNNYSNSIKIGPNVKFLDGHSEAIMDTGQDWLLDGWRVGRTEFAGGGNIFGGAGVHTQYKNGIIEDVYGGQILTVASDLLTEVENVRIINSQIKTPISIGCGVKFAKFRDIISSGRDSGHDKDPSSEVDNTLVKIDCDDSDYPLTMSLFENICEPVPASHQWTDPQRGRGFLFTTGSEKGVVGNVFRSNCIGSESDDSALYVVEGTTPTAAQMAALQIAQQNAIIASFIPQGNLIGYNKSTSGTPGAPSLTAPVSINGSGNMKNNYQIDLARDQDLIFCGDLVDAGDSQTWVGPATGAYFNDGTDYSVGSAGCNALDGEANEAAVDAPIATIFPGFIVNGFWCSISSDPTNDVMITMHSAAAAMTPSPTCTIAGTGSAQTCSTIVHSGVAANAPVSLQVDYNEDLDATDIWCKASITLVDE